MSLIDYKVSDVTHNGSHVKMNVCYFAGSMQDVVDYDGNLVNQYVRGTILRQFTLEFDVLRTMNEEDLTQFIQTKLNKKIAEYANVEGHTVVPEQQTVTEPEDVNNETET